MNQKKPSPAKKNRPPVRPKTPIQTSNHLSFPVVAIGASAGGLEALKQFFQAMPANSGIAFVVIQHLDPDKLSMMATILSRSTEMTTSQACHGDIIKPNHVYVAPPGKQVLMQNGCLNLDELPKDKLLSSHTFDEFLRSMAAAQGDRAICIILSGAGSDGSLGLKAVKQAGGMAMVQAPSEAGYDGMPRSAINTGLVDYVLPIPSMPGELLQYVRHDYYDCRDNALSPEDEIESQVTDILDLLGKKRSMDFTGYKRGTLVRRIERRMNLLHLQDIRTYSKKLRQDEKELDALAKDLVIVVTGFFRDQEAFSMLHSKVIAPLCQQAIAEAPIRVWVAGTATGEEAYTIAILILEELSRSNKEHYGLQIFATDIDKVGLQHARAGIFRPDIEADVSQERLERFFEKRGGVYHIKKIVREKITFSEHDLIRDTPFSRIDFISCRNLLIYLKAETQSRILSLFHFALRSGGMLFLGNTETIGRAENLFRSIDKRWRIYKKIDSVRIPLITFPRSIRGGGPHVSSGEPKNTLTLKSIGERELLKNFSPCGVIVNQTNEILQFLGNTNSFLTLPEGDPTINLISLVPKVVRTPLRAMLQALNAGEQTPPSVLLRLPDHEGRPYRQIKISAKRVEEHDVIHDLYLVVFADLPTECEIFLPEIKNSSHESFTAHEMIITQLEEELLQTRRSLEDTIEQMEATNEELKANNEEALSMNEEIQSTNEELETSKEELQSMNEELVTVNSQLNEKVTELEESNNDLDNLLANSEVGVLFLDEQLRIKRFTPAAQKLFHLFPTDLGRPLLNFDTAFSQISLIAEAKKVLSDLVPIEKEVRDAQNRCYLQRVLPYRTRDNHTKGVLITFLDITTLKRKEDAARQADLLKGLNDTLPLRLAYIDAEERHLFANKAYRDGFACNSEDVLGLAVQEVVGKTFYDAASPFIKKTLAGENSQFEKTFDVPGLGQRNLLCNFSPHLDESGKVTGFFVILQDMTEFRQAESNMSWLSAIVESSHDAIISRTFDGTIRSWNWGAEEMFGYKAEEMLGKKIDTLFSSEQQEGSEDLDLLCHGAGSGHSEPICHTKYGRDITVLLTQSPILAQDGQPVAVSVIMSDLCSSKENERQLQEANKDLESKVAERTVTLQQHMAQLRRLALELTQTEQRERQRLASVLHNDLQQLLVAAGLRMERLANSETDSQKLLAIKQVETLLSQAVTATRSLATDLRPPILNSENMVKSLHWLAEWLWKRFDFSLKLTVAETLPADIIPDEDIVFLFDAARELCFNIVKHAHVKEGRLTLQRTEQDRLLLSIADDGVGMSMEQHPAQAASSGGGLGLAAIRERLALIGGELNITSTAGQGFRADIILPYTLTTAARPKSIIKKKTDKAIPTPPGGKRKNRLTAAGQKIRVMLVDDHAVVRDGLKMILLDEEDIDVIGEANDGEKALKMADKLRPNIIIMDVNMPRMNGIEATKLITQEHPEICVIALSINDDPGTNNAMLKAGACSYLNKSGSSDDVCEMIRACQRKKLSHLPETADKKKPTEKEEE